MLHLSRQVGQTIFIGNNITITVLGVQGGNVKIGINAPKDVSVDREEVRIAKVRDQQRN